jgi:glycosyltransferase involved in cell wall biosynthesis
MNIAQLQYRLKIGGFPWLLKTALGVFKELCTPRTAEVAQTLGSNEVSGALPSILYLHAGWAIESVGRLWLAGRTDCRPRFASVHAKDLPAICQREFNIVWFGYSSLASRIPIDPERAVIAVHDPVELFPEVASWKAKRSISPAKRELLLRARAVVVISQEMQDILAENGVLAHRLPTRSTMPLRDLESVPANCPASFLSVGRIYRRKNFEQFRRVSARAASLGITSRLKCDHFPLSADDYRKLLDTFPIYVCTSFQEGGPLPLMDAMHRGAVPVSTPVGQAKEIIHHGINGFLCQTDEEFLDVLSNLAKDPAKLFSLRKNSLKSIADLRSPEAIGDAVTKFLQAMNIV